MTLFKKDDLTSWQVHEPNNNQDNIHFRVHFFLYVDNPQLLTIIMKKFSRSSTPRFIWNVLFVLNKLIQSDFTFFFAQFQFNNIKKSIFLFPWNNICRTCESKFERKNDRAKIIVSACLDKNIC